MKITTVHFQKWSKLRLQERYFQTILSLLSNCGLVTWLNSIFAYAIGLGQTVIMQSQNIKRLPVIYHYYWKAIINLIIPFLSTLSMMAYIRAI